MTHVIVFAAGLALSFLFTFLVTEWRIKRWVRTECAAQGPDYIKEGLFGNWRASAIGAVLSFIVLVALDWLVLAPRDHLYNLLRTILPSWTGSGQVTWAIWLGWLLGGLLGVTLGQRTAVSGHANPKCKHLLTTGWSRVVPW